MMSSSYQLLHVEVMVPICLGIALWGLAGQGPGAVGRRSTRRAPSGACSLQGGDLAPAQYMYGRAKLDVGQGVVV